jgi:hypothetical protein
MCSFQMFTKQPFGCIKTSACIHLATPFWTFISPFIVIHYISMFILNSKKNLLTCRISYNWWKYYIWANHHTCNKMRIIYIISLVCQSVCRGPENCPLELKVPKTIQGLEFLRPFPHSNYRKQTSSMLQSPSSLCFLFVSATFQSPRNLQAPSAFFLYL